MYTNDVINLRFLLPLLLINSLHRTRSYQFTKPVCDWAEYYEPYIQIRESRTEMPILDVRDAGHYDLLRYSGILCINGPAFLHTKLDTVTLSESEEKATLFQVDPAAIQIFENSCLTFNIREQSDYENTELQPLNEETKVAGLKVYAVTLFGDTDDYRKPAKEWYNDPHFGFNVPNGSMVNGASFAFAVAPTGKLQSGPNPADEAPCVETEGQPCPPPSPPKTKPVKTLADVPQAFCLSINELRVNITFVPTTLTTEDDDTGVVCTVKEPYGDPDISIYFPTNLTSMNYEWYDCPPGDYTNFAPTPNSLDISPLDDFRAIHPSTLTNEGTKGKKPKPSYPGYPKADKNPFLPPTYGKFPYPGYYFHNEPNFNGGNKKEETDLSFKNVRYDVSECLEVPKPDDSCDEDGNEQACEFLDHVMARVKSDWHIPLVLDPNTGEPVEPTGDPVEPAYEKRAQGAWRIEILDLIEDIFVKACPQVSPMLAPAIGRVIEFYLVESLKNEELVKNWTDPEAKQKWTNNKVLDDLQECNTKLSDKNHLDFGRVRNPATLNEITSFEKSLSDPGLSPKDFGQMQSHLTQKKYRFPFEIKLMKENSVHNIFYHKEAAEIDYDFNLAIDIHWKIFNTVIGYCNNFYSARMPATLPNVYSLYNEHIFSFLQEKWLNADETSTDNQVFDQLFGAFVNGAQSMFLDSCMEGAYVSTNVTWREKRLVSLRPDTTETEEEQQQPRDNFFTKMPPKNYNSQISSNTK